VAKPGWAEWLSRRTFAGFYGLIRHAMSARQDGFNQCGSHARTLDPVRYISNRSSGKMGYALAEAALQAGAQVTL